MWLTGWGYRKGHIINPASGAGQNYQKRVMVRYGAGVDSDEDVYLDGKCLTDFGDIRFTDSTGAALLDYWIEKKVDSDYAIFWVEVTGDLSVYDRKIFVYYNKAGATSIADGDATFVFFDDFEVDLSKWQFVTNASISTDHAYNGTKCVKLQVVSGNSGQVGKLLTQANVAIHVHYYDVESAEVELHGFIVSDGAGHDSAIGVMTDIAQYEYMPDAFSPPPINTGIDRSVDWHEFIIRCHANDLAQPWLGGSRQFLVDGILLPVTTSDYANIFLLTASNGGGTPATGKSYWDSCFMTKYINPEPIHGAWGAEESDGIGINTFVAEDIEDTISQTPLVLEDTIYSLVQKTLATEDVLVSLVGSPHIPIPAEELLFSLARLKTWIAKDELFSLSSSPHVPISSEDILLSLLAQRSFGVVTEFPSISPAIIMLDNGNLAKKILSKFYVRL